MLGTVPKLWIYILCHIKNIIGQCIPNFELSQYHSSNAMRHCKPKFGPALIYFDLIIHPFKEYYKLYSTPIWSLRKQSSINGSPLPASSPRALMKEKRFKAYKTLRKAFGIDALFSFFHNRHVSSSIWSYQYSLDDSHIV